MYIEKDADTDSQVPYLRFLFLPISSSTLHAGISIQTLGITDWVKIKEEAQEKKKALLEKRA